MTSEGGDTPEEFERKIESAIAAEQGGSTIVTKFMLLAEVVDSDGNRFLHGVSSSHCYEWDQRGMMASHTAYLDARSVSDYFAQE